LSAWLDGELAPAQRAEVEAHLADCEECAALLADMGAVDELARELPAEAPPEYFETFPERVRTRVESAPRARPGAPSTRWRVPAWTWAAAAVLLLAVVTPLTLDRLDRSGAPTRQDTLAQAPKEGPKLGAISKNLEERDEAAAADQDRAPEAPGKRETGRDRRRQERPGEPKPAFAAAPAPEPIDAATSRPPTVSRASGAETLAAVTAPPDSGAPGRWTDAPSSDAEVAVLAEGEALEETLTAAPELRRQVAKDDVATRGAAAESAPAAATVPRKGRVAAPQTVELQGGLASAEKKTVPEDALTFARLARHTPSGAAAWRAHREEWRAFVAAHPESRHVDEARVRVIEAGLEAWQAGANPEDLARARTDADVYLARGDARQRERVLGALDAEKTR
jgi:hypothetical protein